MRIIIKIVLSFVAFILSVLINAGLQEASGGHGTGGLAGILALAFIGALIGIWAYKPAKEESTKVTDKDDISNIKNF